MVWICSKAERYLPGFTEAPYRYRNREEDLLDEHSTFKLLHAAGKEFPSWLRHTGGNPNFPVCVGYNELREILRGPSPVPWKNAILRHWVPSDARITAILICCQAKPRYTFSIGVQDAFAPVKRSILYMAATHGHGIHADPSALHIPSWKCEPGTGHMAVHGTTMKSWNSILKMQKMVTAHRAETHFSLVVPRGSQKHELASLKKLDVLIFIDPDKVMEFYSVWINVSDVVTVWTHVLEFSLIAYACYYNGEPLPGSPAMPEDKRDVINHFLRHRERPRSLHP